MHLNVWQIRIVSGVTVPHSPGQRSAHVCGAACVQKTTVDPTLSKSRRLSRTSGTSFMIQEYLQHLSNRSSSYAALIDAVNKLIDMLSRYFPKIDFFVFIKKLYEINNK